MEDLFSLDREECEAYEAPKFSDSRSFWIWLICTVMAIILSIVFFMCAGIPEVQSAEISHFKQSEFACKCCGKVIVDERLTRKLDHLRHELGDVPIIITSGYRCPRHNKGCGGANRSYHMKGLAVDIKVEHYSPAEVARVAKMVGFTGIGTYRSWTHVDLRGGDLVCWKR